MNPDTFHGSNSIFRSPGMSRKSVMLTQGFPSMTMREVAERAGVSLATVSRVLSGSNRVRPETAAAVQRIVDDLNFVPNSSAATLQYGRSNTFGILIANC